MALRSEMSCMTVRKRPAKSEVNMGAFIARQPNGLLCRFSSVVDCVTHINMTEEDYIEYRAECAREEAKFDLQSKSFIKPYDWVLDRTLFNNMTEKKFLEIRREMGENI